MVEKVFDDLKKEGLKGKTMAVMVRYSNFETFSSQRTEDEYLTLEKAKKIALQLLLPYLGKTKGIRLLGVRMTNFKMVDPLAIVWQNIYALLRKG